MTKGLVQLTGDDEYIKKRRAAERRDASGQGAGTDFANEVSEGFSGIFAKPMAGYAEGGASGFFKGLGNGLLGAVVKPTAGLSDLISKGAEVRRARSTHNHHVGGAALPAALSDGTNVHPRHVHPFSSHSSFPFSWPPPLSTASMPLSLSPPSTQQHLHCRCRAHSQHVCKSAGIPSTASQAARDTSKTASSEPTRVRPPRVCTVDGVLRNYDSRSAHGNIWPLPKWRTILCGKNVFADAGSVDRV